MICVQNTMNHTQSLGLQAHFKTQFHNLNAHQQMIVLRRYYTHTHTHTHTHTYIYMDYKKNEILPFAAMRVDLENIFHRTKTKYFKVCLEAKKYPE